MMAGDPRRPSAARMVNYLLGGTVSYEPDRHAAARVEAVLPEARRMAADADQFTRRAAAWAAARAGQVLILGAGLTAGPPLHPAPPGVPVACTDPDPAVCDALDDALDGTGRAVVACADPADPQAVLAAVKGVIDPSRPVCLIASAVPRALPPRRARTVIGEYARLLAPGSYLAVAVPRFPDPGQRRAVAAIWPAPVRSWAAADLAGLLAGLDVAGPGIAAARHLRPGWREAPPLPGGPCMLAAIARTV